MGDESATRCHVCSLYWPIDYSADILLPGLLFFCGVVINDEGEILFKVQLDTIDTVEPSLLHHWSSTAHTQPLFILPTVVLLGDGGEG